MEEEQIVRSIQIAESKLAVSMSVSEQYIADSRRILAENWLKTWYVAETLAKHASKYSCEYGEGEYGAGDFQFNFVVKDITSMAKDLAEFAQAFDPDNLEAGAFIYGYAYEWLEKRGNANSHFPDIESKYRNDAEEYRDIDEE